MNEESIKQKVDPKKMHYKDCYTIAVECKNCGNIIYSVYEDVDYMDFIKLIKRAYLKEPCLFVCDQCDYLSKHEFICASYKEL